MTDPRHDLDLRIRQALEQEADAAPRADLTDGALAQARRIRTRRRLTTVAAAAVLVAAVPVGATLLAEEGPDGTSTPATQPSTPPATSAPTEPSPPESKQTPPEDPDQPNLFMGDLERGTDPSVPYLDSGALVAAGQTTTLEVPAGADLLDAVEFEEGIVAWAADPQTGQVHMFPQGFSPGIDLSGTAGEPVIDGSTGDVAFTVGDTVYYGTSLAPDIPGLQPDGVRGVTLLDALDGVVVFSGTVDRRPMVGTIDFTASPPTYERMFDEQDWVDAYAFSQRGRLMSQQGQDTVPGDPNDSPCAVVTELDHVNTGGWASCKWRVVSFSPDGTRALAFDTRSEGFGPRLAAIVDARTGDVLLNLFAEGTFGFEPSWESEDVVDVVLVEDGEAAVIRCTAGVGCELATDPEPAEPDSLVAPYQLTTG